MNKTTIIILASAIILLLIIGGIWFYYSGKPAEEIPLVISGLFPSSEDQEIPGFPEGETGGLGEGGAGAGQGATNKLIQLTKNAISGAGVSSTTVRYVEKETGHIYEIAPDGQNRQRLSNITILKTLEALWNFRADKLIIRYFGESDLKTFSFDLASSQTSTTTAVQGVFFPLTTAAVAVSPDEDKVFYLLTTNGTTKGITANFANKNQKNIFENPFGEFNVSWPKGDTITLLAKPSVSATGFFYSLNPQTNKFEKLIGDVNGLTAILSPDGMKIIYSQSENDSFETKVFNLKEKKSVSFGLRTLPEKCVWSKLNKNVVFCGIPNEVPQGDYPDLWYQGLISFSDSVWEEDFSTGKTSILFEETNSDIVNPLLSKDENYLIFTNKNDNTLWSLKIR